MLTENTHHDTLMQALVEVYDYSDNSIRNQQVQRAMRRGKDKIVRRVNTPSNKHTALYYYYKENKEIKCAFYLVLKGSEGDSFACPPIWDDVDYDIVVLHSHAINRYMQRTDFKGSLEEAQTLLASAVGVFKAVHDSDTYYLSFYNGVFLGNVVDNILHLRTFINTEQCHTNQKLWRIKSANSLNELAKRFEELAKEMENA